MYNYIMSVCLSVCLSVWLAGWLAGYTAIGPCKYSVRYLRKQLF